MAGSEAFVFCPNPAHQSDEPHRAPHGRMHAANRLGRRRVVRLMAAMGWKRHFDQPIKLPGGGQLVTLKDAIAWLAKEIPQSEHLMKEVQAAAHCVTEAAENGGPLMFARMGMMQAINRDKPEEFDPKQKSPHWGKRKLKRDE
jgi:hypothetical protein